MSQTKNGLFVRLHAKTGMEKELSSFLAGALPLANLEKGTLNWFAIQFDKSTFGIFDTFPGDHERDAHLHGEIAAALMANASKLLAQAPVIEKIDILAKK